MKLRVLIPTLLLSLTLAASMASAQSIGLFGDPSGASCNLVVNPGVAGTGFLIAIPGGPVTGITGAEFRVAGLPGGWFAISTPNPASNLSLGDPFTTGANIAFPTCQAGGPVTLYTVTLIATSVVTDGLFEVVAKTPPSNPNFDCPLVTLCDAPAFTKVCVGGGAAFLNSSNECTVAVEETSWSRLKALYN